MKTKNQTMDTLAEIRESLSRIEQKLDTPDYIEREWLDPDQICQMLNITRRTLDAYRTKGLLPYSKIGGRVFCRFADVEDYLNSHIVRKEERS